MNSFVILEPWTIVMELDCQLQDALCMAHIGVPPLTLPFVSCYVILPADILSCL